LIMETARDYAQSSLEPRALKGNTEEYFDNTLTFIGKSCQSD
jgi:glutaryl-CoA dehydrogenase